MIGVRVDPDHGQAVYADMFALANEFTALAGLGKQRLSKSEVKKGKQIIEQLSAHIRDSYDDTQVREIR